LAATAEEGGEKKSATEILPLKGFHKNLFTKFFNRNSSSIITSLENIHENIFYESFFTNIPSPKFFDRNSSSWQQLDTLNHTSSAAYCHWCDL